jgi:hypothetical protein
MTNMSEASVRVVPNKSRGVIVRVEGEPADDSWGMMKVHYKKGFSEWFCGANSTTSPITHHHHTSHHGAVPLSGSCTITITITVAITITVNIIITITITITITRRVTISSIINTTVPRHNNIMPVPQKKMKPGPNPQKIIQLSIRTETRLK